MPAINETVGDVKTFWDKVMEFLTPSTVRAIVLAIGTLGWKFTEGTFEAWITTVSAVVYIAYEFFRTDSAQKAIDIVNNELVERGILKGDNGYIKPSLVLILLTFMCLALIVPAIAKADSALCVEPQITSGTYTLIIDGGTPIPDLPFIAETDGSGVDWHCIYDVGTLGGGQHSFQVFAVDSSGWEGPIMAVPFSATRPNAITRARILQIP